MAETQAGAARRRVLIAEDEALIRLDLAEMLVEMGLLADYTATGLTWPLKRVGEAPTDLIRESPFGEEAGGRKE